MRAKTKKKHEMGKRFAIVIGVAAAAVMVLGAQTALAATGGHFEGKVEGGGGIHFDTTTIRKGKTKQVFVDTLTQVPVSCDERNGLLNLQILPEPGQGITGTQVVGDNSLRVKHGSFRFTPEDQPGGQTITFRGKFNKTAKKATGTYRAQGDLFLGPVYKTGGVKERSVGTPPGDQGGVLAHNCDTGTVEWSARKRTPPSMRTTGDPVDSTPPDLQLSGPKKQSPQKASCPPSDPGCSSWICSHQRCDVIVRVSCGDEVCTVRAWGKLTNVKMDKLDPAGPYETFVEPGKRPPNTGPELEDGEQRKQVRKALDGGENVQAKVTVKATDAAGNVATAKRTITLVK